MNRLKVPSHPLPATVRDMLIPLPREEWTAHDNYFTSNARALVRNHTSLKKQARQYHGALTHLLSLNGQDRLSEETASLLPVIQAHLKSLLRNLHSHHGYEDSSVFPVVRLHHPRLAAAIDLMEQDHSALDALLAKLEARTRAPLAALQDLSVLEPSRKEANDLEVLLHGHMQNEEEILVPMYLTYG